MAEGQKCVLETLSYFNLEALVIDKNWETESNFLQGIDPARVFWADHKQLEQISSLSTAPKMLAVYRIPQKEIPAADALADELIIALDGIQDPGNLGTIMRAADWFGVKHIIASHQTADIFNPKSVQASMGAIGRVSIYYADLDKFLTDYKSATGRNVYGTLLEGENIYTSALQSNGVIIMGNEGNGISAEIRNLIDMPLLIPSYPVGAQRVESLNVAMATAITLAEFRRRQDTDKKE
ncbi:MAG: RNA methyltransferase [Lachnospiraceae bacterium]|nr:RNA methyltransferase [Lachnospiraceae bacterium]